MITRIEIEKLRGIERGVLAELSPLTVLVGTNGCGKSTVLDALLIGASPSPGDAIGRAVQRREELSRGAPWLFWRASAAAKIVVETTESGRRTTPMILASGISGALARRLDSDGAPPPFDEIDSEFNVGVHTFWSKTAFAASNVFEFDQGPRIAPTRNNEAVLDEEQARVTLSKLPPVRLLEPGAGSHHGSFQRLYTQVVQAGMSEAALAVARAVVPDLVRVEILTPDDVPVVHLVFSDHAMPLAAAGDGVKSVIRLAFELAIRGAGLVLIEEPEVHQHPGAIVQSARVILEAVRRGAQIVLSTHSLELIDALVAHSTSADLERFCVQRLKLGSGGELTSVRTRGEDVAFERGDIDQDLR